MTPYESIFSKARKNDLELVSNPRPDLEQESMPTQQPALLEVPATLPPATAWSGGTHDGSRLAEEERFKVRTLWAEGLSIREIARQTNHGRNTIEALISSPAYAEELKVTRAHRALVREEILRRAQDDVIEEKMDAGKASIADLTNAIMVNSIIIKEAGGSAPTRILLEADPTFLQAAQLFGAAAPQSPVRPVQEAEIVPNDKAHRQTGERKLNQKD